jgi:hypothetical protein
LVSGKSLPLHYLPRRGIVKTAFHDFRTATQEGTQMIRRLFVPWAVVSLGLAMAARGDCQGSQQPPGPDTATWDGTVVDIGTPATMDKNKVEILVTGGASHGHVVVRVPGTRDRVWDGDTIGGFKDLADGNLKNLGDGTNQEFKSVLERMNNFLKTEYPTDAFAGKRPGKNATEQEQAKYRQDLELYFAKMDAKKAKEYLDRYENKGAPVSQSWDLGSIGKDGKFKPGQNAPFIVGYQLPAPKDKNGKSIDVRQVIKDYKTPDGFPANLRCNDLVLKAAPVVARIVFDENAPKGKAAQEPTANNMNQALFQQAQRIQQAAPPPAVKPPPPPPQTPIIQQTPREQKVVPKPGGVIIAADATIDGLRPKEVASAAFNAKTGVLTLRLKTGGQVECRLDADDFTVAVRCVFDRQVDPSLSMNFAPEKPGYHSVNYCGPLFKTPFGKALYEADVLLGALLFNREGPHRFIAAEIIPHFVDLACESYHTMTLGSRVFLRATEANFQVDNGRLVCREVKARVEVEGLGYAASYYQEPLHRLARALNDKFEQLAERFDEFQEIRELAQCVALAKWLQRHAVPFDWSELKSRAIAEQEFPAYSPTSEWYCLFNGRNLDGWRVNLPGKDLTWGLEQGGLALKPAGTKGLEILSSTWRADYDVRLTVASEGPVEVIVRKGAGPAGAAVTINTKGKPQKVELFLVNGAWTALAPGLGKQGKVVLPEVSKGQARPASEFGLRVPPGSRITLFAAALRGRPSS